MEHSTRRVSRFPAAGRLQSTVGDARDAQAVPYRSSGLPRSSGVSRRGASSSASRDLDTLEKLDSKGCKGIDSVCALATGRSRGDVPDNDRSRTMSTESRKQMKKRAFLFSGMTQELQWTLDSTGV